MNFAKFLRRPFLQNTSGWLLLYEGFSSDRNGLITWNQMLIKFNTKYFPVFFRNKRFLDAVGKSGTLKVLKAP